MAATKNKVTSNKRNAVLTVLPDGYKARLASLADADRRSLSQYCSLVLQDHADSNAPKGEQAA